MSEPPPSSQDPVLRRVLKISRINGWSVTIVAGVCTLIALLLGDLVSTAVGLLVTVGGVMEVYGRRRLLRGNASAMRWLVRAQLIVLGTIWAYAAARLASFDEELARQMATPGIQTMLTELDVTLDEIMPLVRTAFYALYGGLIAATLLYQGGLAVYYHRRRGAVARAMQTSTPGAMGSRFV